ncbi:DUF1963 domain-containing protein [Serinibacter salmoneus]|uniref:Uncharacterized protein DUF1963 n=1 Tax=Serinibacter salmoneus TaxID=556530 RepID=A0A2A9D4K8_9MICO|nr:DUF1963 domain-containing protein [Serinibacter salmoneus]PFG20790.1 uncharacterized protein DUF1963 [Serinibacter salmoneus]
MRNPAVGLLESPTYSAVRAWVDRTGRGELSASPAVLFREEHLDNGDDVRFRWSMGRTVNWFGCCAVAPLQEWPRRADGVALHHVLALDLRLLAGLACGGAMATWPGFSDPLPQTGMLEVFHDLITPGTSPADAHRGAWRVRWVPQVETGALIPPPGDLTTAALCRRFVPQAGFTTPPEADVRARRVPSARRLSRGARRLRDSLRSAWQGKKASGFSHAFGYPEMGETTSRPLVRDVLPVSAGDDHTLLLDLDLGALPGVCPRGTRLEVWMRDTDLATARFERAWCLLRHDT